MVGPYVAENDGSITYSGNNLFHEMRGIETARFPTTELETRVRDLKNQSFWGAIGRINHRVNMSANNFFDEMGALFVPLPLTTRMISSPGAVYGREAISYTSDTSPITINWFDLPDTAFLSESSQIYLELAMMQEGVDAVYSIYNSFRKEKADFTHLSEFHHIEYEGTVDQAENEGVALDLTRRLITDLMEKDEEALRVFLTDTQIGDLDNMARSLPGIPRLTYREALDILHEDTGDDKYRQFTMDGVFGSWDEVRLTNILGTMVGVTQFPLLEVPFYHTQVEGVNPPVADNTDLIWPGYREFLGSGHRVRSTEELEYKAEVFELPRDDYMPYLQTRELEGYTPTSGFGLGWERFIQGVLNAPTIWSMSAFPRGDTTLRP